MKCPLCRRKMREVAARDSKRRPRSGQMMRCDPCDLEYYDSANTGRRGTVPRTASRETVASG